MCPRSLDVCLRMLITMNQDKAEDTDGKSNKDKEAGKDRKGRKATEAAEAAETEEAEECGDDVNVLILTTPTAAGLASDPKFAGDGDDLGIDDGNVVFGKPISRLHLNNLKRSHDVLAAAHDVADRKDRIVKARIEVESLQLEVFKKQCELNTAEKLLAACKADEQQCSIDLLRRADAWRQIV